MNLRKNFQGLIAISLFFSMLTGRVLGDQKCTPFSPPNTKEPPVSKAYLENAFDIELHDTTPAQLGKLLRFPAKLTHLGFSQNEVRLRILKHLQTQEYGMIGVLDDILVVFGELREEAKAKNQPISDDFIIPIAEVIGKMGPRAVKASTQFYNALREVPMSDEAYEKVMEAIVRLGPSPLLSLLKDIAPRNDNAEKHNRYQISTKLIERIIVAYPEETKKYIDIFVTKLEEACTHFMVSRVLQIAYLLTLFKTDVPLTVIQSLISFYDQNHSDSHYSRYSGENTIIEYIFLIAKNQNQIPKLVELLRHIQRKNLVFLIDNNFGVDITRIMKDCSEEEYSLMILEVSLEEGIIGYSSDRSLENLEYSGTNLALDRLLEISTNLKEEYSLRSKETGRVDVTFWGGVYSTTYFYAYTYSYKGHPYESIIRTSKKPKSKTPAQDRIQKTIQKIWRRLYPETGKTGINGEIVKSQSDAEPTYRSKRELLRYEGIYSANIHIYRWGNSDTIFDFFSVSKNLGILVDKEGKIDTRYLWNLTKEFDNHTRKILPQEQNARLIIRQMEGLPLLPERRLKITINLQSLGSIELIILPDETMQSRIMDALTHWHLFMMEEKKLDSKIDSYKSLLLTTSLVSKDEIIERKTEGLLKHLPSTKEELRSFLRKPSQVSKAVQFIKVKEEAKNNLPHYIVYFLEDIEEEIEFVNQNLVVLNSVNTSSSPMSKMVWESIINRVPYTQKPLNIIALKSLSAALNDPDQYDPDQSLYFSISYLGDGNTHKKASKNEVIKVTFGYRSLVKADEQVLDITIPLQEAGKIQQQDILSMKSLDKITEGVNQAILEMLASVH